MARAVCHEVGHAGGGLGGEAEEELGFDEFEFDQL
jgi:hypothetical protein